MADAHGPQTPNAAQVVHDKAHEINSEVQRMHDEGYDEHPLGSRRVLQEGQRFHELISRYHQITGRRMINDDMACLHCGEEL